MTLLIAAPADQVCPKSIPSLLTVSYKKECCLDAMPGKGRCLVPGTIYFVDVVKPRAGS